MEEREKEKAKRRPGKEKRGTEDGTVTDREGRSL